MTTQLTDIPAILTRYQLILTQLQSLLKAVEPKSQNHSPSVSHQRDLLQVSKTGSIEIIKDLQQQANTWDQIKILKQQYLDSVFQCQEDDYKRCLNKDQLDMGVKLLSSKSKGSEINKMAEIDKINSNMIEFQVLTKHLQNLKKEQKQLAVKNLKLDDQICKLQMNNSDDVKLNQIARKYLNYELLSGAKQNKNEWRLALKQIQRLDEEILIELLRLSQLKLDQFYTVQSQKHKIELQQKPSSFKNTDQLSKNNNSLQALKQQLKQIGNF